MQERGLEHIDRRAKDGLTRRHALNGLTPGREAAHEVGRNDQQVGFATVLTRSLKRVANQVRRAVCRPVDRGGRAVGLQDGPQAVHLGRRRRIGSAGIGRRCLGQTVVTAILDVVDHVLKLHGHIEIERRLDAARHDLRPGRLGRAADLHRELERLAILRARDADGRQAGLVDLGAVAAVTDQVHGRAVGDARQWRRPGRAANAR